MLLRAKNLHFSNISDTADFAESFDYQFKTISMNYENNRNCELVNLCLTSVVCVDAINE